MIAINHTVSDDSQERKNKNKQKKNLVTQVCAKDKGKTQKLTHEAGKASCGD